MQRESFPPRRMKQSYIFIQFYAQSYLREPRIFRKLQIHLQVKPVERLPTMMPTGRWHL